MLYRRVQHALALPFALAHLQGLSPHSHPSTVFQYLHLEDAHLAPALGELGDTLTHSLGSHEILHDEEIEFLAKSEEMGKERVEVCFDREMDDLLEMRVVEMCEYPKQVLVNVFGSVRKRRREIAA